MDKNTGCEKSAEHVAPMPACSQAYDGFTHEWLVAVRDNCEADGITDTAEQNAHIIELLVDTKHYYDCLCPLCR
jgi:hypothetical protein